MDIEEYFSVIHKYLKEQENINEDILNKAEAIEKFLIWIYHKRKIMTRTTGKILRYPSKICCHAVI